MKLNSTLVLTALAAGGMIAGGSAIADETNTLSSMATNATSKISHMFGGGGGAMGKIEEKLGLTDEQKQKVDSIFSSEKQQMKDVHKDNTLSTGEAKSKMQDIRDSVDTKLKSVLTPEQYQKWQSLSEKLHMEHTPGSTTAPSGSTP
jgi:Spy/CpxP family protein refolding chaperone